MHRLPKLCSWINTDGDKIARQADISKPAGLSYLVSFFLLKAISGFFEAGRPPAQTEETQLDDYLVEFDSDQCLFEVFSQVFFHLDLWLHRNGHHRFRTEVFNGSVRSFCLDLFQSLLKASNLNEVLENRLQTYAAVHASDVTVDQKIERNRFYFCQFLYRTKRTNSLQIYDVQHDFRLIIAQFTKEYALSSNLAAYLKPACFQHILTTCER